MQAALGDTLDQLAAVGPDFISVTYGANGSSRTSSLEVLGELLTRGVDPMAHLTCVGSTLVDESRVIREFLDTGITRFFALRGDPPADLGVGEEFLGELRSAGCGRHIGPGVYDIHSPRVPTVAEITELLDRAASTISHRQLWVNPDCGLKARGYRETVASLHNIVEATRALREKAGARG